MSGRHLIPVKGNFLVCCFYIHVGNIPRGFSCFYFFFVVLYCLSASGPVKLCGPLVDVCYLSAALPFLRLALHTLKSGPASVFEAKKKKESQLNIHLKRGPFVFKETSEPHFEYKG